jgi:hypothetical protein
VDVDSNLDSDVDLLSTVAALFLSILDPGWDKSNLLLLLLLLSLVFSCGKYTLGRFGCDSPIGVVCGRIATSGKCNLS